jgi:hypothetical protein
MRRLFRFDPFQDVRTLKRNRLLYLGAPRPKRTAAERHARVVVHKRVPPGVAQPTYLSLDEVIPLKLFARNPYRLRGYECQLAASANRDARRRINDYARFQIKLILLQLPIASPGFSNHTLTAAPDAISDRRPVR